MADNAQDLGIDVLVAVESAGYTGVIVDERDGEYLVRYIVPNARRSFYETWWPAAYLKVLPS